MSLAERRVPILLSILAAVVTLGLKAVAYFLTDSVGLLSDAAESLVNLVAAVTALVCLWYSALPVDKTHTYGHEKIEFFSSGLEGILILVAASGIAWHAIGRLFYERELGQLEVGVAISFAASLINLGVARLLIRVGRRTNSILLEADGQHLMTDVWTSFGVIVGLILVKLTTWTILDPLLALAVAGNIVWTAWDLIKRSFNGLMDHALPAEEQQIVRTAVEALLHPGLHYHALRTRQAGARRFVDFHLLVPGTWTVKAAHDFTETVEAAVRTALPGAEVTVHIEPIEAETAWHDSELLKLEDAAARERAEDSNMLAPDRIHDAAHLDELLSEPTPHAIDTLARIDGDLVLLGVAGKMGPTLARMARRATDEAGVKRRIIGVARFTDAKLEGALQAFGVETIRCDLLNAAQLASLPDAANVIAMFGMKFGSTGQEARTWAMNCVLPAFVCQKYRQARLVAFSTGNVYGLAPIAYGGSRECDPMQGAGEYAMSCIGRERIYEYCSQTYEIPMAILRLNYATETRYGVLVDIAQRVFAGDPVDVSMGCLNAIWQADANAAALSAFAHLATPPCVLNIAGPEILSVRRVAEEFATRFDREIRFTGVESGDAILSNAQAAHRLFGYPRIGAQQMIAWIADWIARGGATHGKPTHFETRDGKY